MIRITENDYATGLRFSINDNETGEILIAADNLIELFNVFQEVVYTVAQTETNSIIVGERLRKNNCHRLPLRKR